MGTWIGGITALDRDGDMLVARKPPGPGGRLFGGLVAAQALASACDTVPADKLPQSLHAYFVRGGQPDVDVEFVVERTRDGRSFDTRRVTASQGDAVIFEMLASFHVPETAADWHVPAPPFAELDDTTAVLLPGELSERFELRAPGGDAATFMGPPYWIRAREAVEDDPVARACALAYVSDIALMAAARPPGLKLGTGIGMAASLDHSIWFHRPFHAEHWHRYEASSVNNNDARGLALGALHDAAGTRIATMAQEALWRV